jgi:hypothetical protein
VNWPVVIVQWLHVGLGVLWFGSVLYNATILIPAVSTMPLARQREVGNAIGAQAFKVIGPAAIAVIVLGILRGTVFGRIQSLDALATPYGMAWLVSLVFAIGAYFWVERAIRPALDRMSAIPEAEAVGPDGQPTPQLTAAIERVKRVTVLELSFFLVIFTCMILMRFL